MQVTDRGKMYMSKKEKNVFILEGTGPAGHSACRYNGSDTERALIRNGEWALIAELKNEPSAGCEDGEVYVLVDLVSVADLSSGCDFCGVKVCFPPRELRIEAREPVF